MQSTLHLTPDAKKHFDALLPKLDEPLQGLAERDQQIFKLRLARYFQHLYDGLEPLYAKRGDFAEVIERLVLRLAEHNALRPEDLKMLDLERDLSPDWFQRESMMGYVFYVERFAKTLQGVEAHLDYIEDIGANYLHLMKVIKARGGENDGGYAVENYRKVEPELGTMDDLENVCRTLRGRGISVCLDLVLNHCAKEHEWAERARAGEKKYRDYFYIYQDRAIPDEYEKTLPEVFPDFAPGNFSHYPELGWVWTTFNEYQWDLNWTNPDIFVEIVDILLFLANKGVEIFRLDAVAFMWKRLGTDSQNQPEVHDILQALRACSRIAAPAVAHKAEAIVSPDDLIHYFGTGKRYGKVSNIAYHNSLMVQFWSSLASRDTRLMTHTLGRFPRPSARVAWGTYIRCHDDIGWAVTEEDAAAVGINGYMHRAFLSDYYSGQFEGSHARGEVFQFNPETNDRRISGSFASLAGLGAALEGRDEHLIALSIERILLGHALIAGFGGIPLLYMGDELGLLNDYNYVQEHPGDNRWVHRPYMDWDAAARRREGGSVEARVFAGTQKIIRARKRTPQFHASYANDIVDSGNPHLFAYSRSHPLGTLVAIYNFSEEQQWVPKHVLSEQGLDGTFDVLEQNFVTFSGDGLVLAPYARLWLI